jgi:hypothetical protein
MKEVIAELSEIVNDFSLKIKAIPEDEFSKKLQANKWSRKEVLGHLIDSAQNNLRRFICGQYENIPPKIVYEQDFWVNSNDYQSAPARDIVTLWKLSNERIVAVLMNMPSDTYSKKCDTEKNFEALHSLEWLAKDYIRHLKHHLNQIIPRSFDIVYP